jgi:hypothetical protein
MKYFLLFFFLTFQHCSKPKTVLICGDHICVNKSEAEQYFEKNLSIEVKIIDKKRKEEISLVELNLRNDISSNKKISLSTKRVTKKKVKTLNKNEIKKIKRQVKKNEKIKKTVNQPKNLKKKKYKKNVENTILSNKDNISKRGKVVDVCTILKKCSIDEISKYLLKEGNKKKFPSLTTKE